MWVDLVASWFGGSAYTLLSLPPPPPPIPLSRSLSFRNTCGPTNTMFLGGQHTHTHMYICFTDASTHHAKHTWKIFLSCLKVCFINRRVATEGSTPLMVAQVVNWNKHNSWNHTAHAHSKGLVSKYNCINLEKSDLATSHPCYTKSGCSLLLVTLVYKYKHGVMCRPTELSVYKY